MTKVYYKRPALRSITKGFSLAILLAGLGILFYVFFPLLSWQIFFAPVFANQNINTPIPKSTVLTEGNIASLFNLSQSLTVDYTNADNWFPKYRYQKEATSMQNYYLSIPKLKIKDAVVSTTDDNLAEHLVHYGGTAIPPAKGTGVIFGHSTLPWLFDTKNYRTIFATLYELKDNDEILLNIDGIKYSYRVYQTSIVEATDNTVFDQNYNDSFLTLVTCTPPGTVWKRLVIRAKIEPI
jgi:sortase A